MCHEHTLWTRWAILNPSLTPEQRDNLIRQARKECENGHNCDDTIFPKIPDKSDYSDKIYVTRII